MTLTMLITIRSCPKTNEISLPFTFAGNTGCTLFTRNLSEKEVTLNIGSLDGKIATSDGPVLRRSVPTLIVFRVLRKNETDPASIIGIQIGAAELGDLQKVPETRKILRQSTPLALPNLTVNDPLYLRIQSENMAFDLFWLHIFDYKVENEQLYREARADWGYLPSI
jgi:hypothetical protein